MQFAKIKPDRSKTVGLRFSDRRIAIRQHLGTASIHFGPTLLQEFRSGRYSIMSSAEFSKPLGANWVVVDVDTRLRHHVAACNSGQARAHHDPDSGMSDLFCSGAPAFSRRSARLASSS
jgi:hypothetical protein